MAKFITLHFRNLPNAAHYNYCKRVSAEFADSPGALIQALGQLPAEFNTWLAEETKQMEWVRKSILTEQIREADHRMDHALTALRMQVHAQEYHPRKAYAEAAHRVYTMLQNYKDVNRKPYEEQEGDVQIILQQLQSGGAYYNDASTLGLGALRNELQASYTLFRELLAQRDEKSLLKPEKSFKEVRAEIENVYHKITAIIDAGALMNISSAYGTFIDHLNPEIKRLNDEYHRVKYNIANSEPEPLQPQLYTGKPLTPSTFKVLYVTPNDGTITLELGKDYNLTFKDNIEVGNAECTIHGKGAYEGKKTVTFVIVRAL
ncbi:MAG: DUF6261 family protein [Tannerella sp.]|jgi:hypothetical protein|nr:DUF6261 family protein [Tannerella sp.]